MEVLDAAYNFTQKKVVLKKSWAKKSLNYLLTQARKTQYFRAFSFNGFKKTKFVLNLFAQQVYRLANLSRSW
jgi:hypothetical protein